jgi:AcrR family transcriptional regulator
VSTTRPRRGPGRRPGPVDTRGEILAAARAEFAGLGYDGASIRGIARSAGVDPALVHHYFGTKQNLFVAAVEIPVNPIEAFITLVSEDRETLGERLLTLFLSVWDRADNRSPVLALIRSAVSEERAAAMLREFITEEILGRVARELGTPDATLRTSLVASQLVGLIMSRYVIRLEPLASTPSEVLVAAVGPTLQRYLTGDVGAAARPAGGSR